MSWRLRIKTKNSGEHNIDIGDEAEAKAALQRAREELQRAMRRGAETNLATFEDQVVVPAGDVTALDIYEQVLPSIG
jgi:hypothetical protein